MRTSVVSFGEPLRHRLVPFHPQQCYLFGDQTQHKHDHRGSQQEYRHIGEAMVGDKRIDVIGHASKKKENADGQKNAKRRKQRCNLRDDQQESDSIGNQAYLALARAIQGLNRDVFDG